MSDEHKNEGPCGCPVGEPGPMGDPGVVKLTAKLVDTIFTDCFLLPAEISTDGTAPLVPHIVAEGIRHRFGFQPDRVAKHAPTIKMLLEQLPKEFLSTEGGGWSFLNACVTRDGEHWGEHQNMEQLVALGLATGHVTYLMPRDMWKAFPGGMPFFTIHLEPQPVAITQPKLAA